MFLRLPETPKFVISILKFMHILVTNRNHASLVVMKCFSLSRKVQVLGCEEGWRG